MSSEQYDHGVPPFEDDVLSHVDVLAGPLSCGHRTTVWDDKVRSQLDILHWSSHARAQLNLMNLSSLISTL